MSTRPTIFVNIAAYRDPETYPTIRDLFEKAANPENIHVGLCWQYNSLTEEPFQLKDRKHQVSVLNIDYKKSKGACWARHTTQKLYHDEQYFLQIDAHSRFVPDWDKLMIEELARCPSNKPILSSYPSHYTLPNTLVDHGPYKLLLNHFHSQVPVFHSRACTEEERQAPSLSAIISGGFVFGPASAMLEVPYDPFIYFIGEEITMSARYWTHGYDIFTPSRTMMFHLYVVPELTKAYHWLDHSRWHDNFEEPSRERVLQLLGYAPASHPVALQQIDRYGMGNVRSLAEYERFAGVDFKAQTMTENGKSGIPQL